MFSYKIYSGIIVDADWSIQHVKAHNMSMNICDMLYYFKSEVAKKILFSYLIKILTIIIRNIP